MKFILPFILFFVIDTQAKDFVFKMPYLKEKGYLCNPVTRGFPCRKPCINRCSGSICKYRNRIHYIDGKDLNIIFLREKYEIKSLNEIPVVKGTRFWDTIYGEKIDTVSGTIGFRVSPEEYKFKNAPVVLIKAIKYREPEKCF